MSVAMFEEMQSEETTISSDDDRVSNLVRESNIELLSNDKDLEINLNMYNFVKFVLLCRKCFCCNCTY